MKQLLIILALGLAIAAEAQTIELDNAHFKCVYPLKAGNELISVTTGHAAPYIYDYDKDGLDDLLVGEFGEVDFDGIDSGEAHDYVQGRCRIYLNHGTCKKPVYTDFQYLSVQGKPMAVPVTCCISFVPRFVDMDADGTDDVLSGSYPGEIYFWKGLGDNEFKEPLVLPDESGNPINAAGSMAVDPIDWDADGDYDLLISSRMSGAFLVENKGNAEHFSFAGPVKLQLQKYLPRKLPTYFLPHDWNGDGLFDLVCGCEEGDLVLYTNVGTKGSPAFGTPEILWENPCKDESGSTPAPLGSRVKLWCYDYNQDGKEDLLAGDVNNIDIQVREITPKEQVRIKKLEQKIAGMDRKFAAEYPELQARYDRKDYPIEYKVYVDHVLAKSKYQMGLYKIKDGFCRSETLGNVWVFIRK